MQQRLNLAVFLIIGFAAVAAPTGPNKQGKPAQPVGKTPVIGSPMATGPNVLFIAVDDLNNSLGCYDHPLVLTPNIDSIASQGRRFDLAYCQFPLCNPSRASVLTGLRPETTGIIDQETQPRSALPDMLTLPQHFRERGYFTAMVGKIFHGGYSDPLSWVEVLGGKDTLSARESDTLVRKKGLDSTSSDLPVPWQINDGADSDGDAITTSKAVAFLRGPHPSPFFLAVGFHKPHLPWIAPRRYFDLYDPAEIELAEAPADDLNDIPQPARSQVIRTPPEADRMARRAYYACISYLDDQVGQVLTALKNSGAFDQTIIVFWSDHGFLLGEHTGMWKKDSLFEEAARVPLIIAAPGMAQRGAPSKGPVELIDLFPTLVDLCGLPMPPGLQGKSLRPILQSNRAVVGETAFTVVKRPDLMGRTVRTPQWRYTEWGSRDTAELYDHENDPNEYDNEAGRSRHRDLIDQLHDLIQAQIPMSSAEAFNRVPDAASIYN